MANLKSATTPRTPLTKVMAQMFRGLSQSRFAGHRLFAQNLKAQYSRSILGIFWEFIEPLAIALVFISLRRGGALALEDISIPYPLFVISGLLAFQVFTDSTMVHLNSIKRASNVLGHVKIHPETIVIASLLEVGFRAIFRLVIIVGTAIWFGYFSLTGTVLFLTAMLFLATLGAGIGLALAPFNVIVSDISTTIGVLTRVLLFLSAAIFPLPSDGALSVLSIANPVAVGIESSRSFLLRSEFDSAQLLLSWWAALVGFLLFGWYAFHVSLRFISGRL